MNVVKKTVNDVTDRVDEAERFLTSPINRVWESLKLVIRDKLLHNREKLF